MPTTKVKGIIIESKDTKEKDKTVVIYTLEEGKIRAVFKGVRGEKAKMKASKDIFTFGDFFIENTKGNNIVSQVDVIDTFYNFSQDLDKYYEACSIVDIVKKIGNQSDPIFFLEVIKSLKAICYENTTKNYVLNSFLLKIFKGAGFSINTNKCASCGAELTGSKFINYDVGEIVCANCKTYTCQKLSSSVVSAINIFAKTPYEKLATVHLEKDVEKETLEILLKNFQCRFGCEIFAVI